jgi:hypothetical protein
VLRLLRLRGTSLLPLPVLRSPVLADAQELCQKEPGALKTAIAPLQDALPFTVELLQRSASLLDEILSCLQKRTIPLQDNPCFYLLDVEPVDHPSLVQMVAWVDVLTDFFKVTSCRPTHNKRDQHTVNKSSGEPVLDSIKELEGESMVAVNIASDGSAWTIRH